MAPATAVPVVLAALGICTVILVASLLVEGPAIDRLAGFARYVDAAREPEPDPVPG